MTDIVRAVAEDEAHIGLAYNPQPDPRISFVASAPAPTKLLVRKNHPLTLIKKPLSLQQVLQYPLALMAAGYGVSQVIETLEYAEHIKFNPLLRSNSIVALKRFVRSTDGVTFFFTGAAAAPELAAGQVAPLDIAHPLCAAAKLRLIVRQSRPLSPAATRMLMEIRRNIPGFGTGGAPSEKSKGNPRGREQGYRQRRLGADHAIAATAERTLPVMTWDRGKELADHQRLTLATEVDVYFCDPRCPWQRGSNENTNRLLRQYLPRGTDLPLHSQAKLSAIARQLKERPRKNLLHQTPAEKFAECVAAIN